MQFRILGTAQVWVGQTPLPVRGTREQKILALLLLHADQVVPLERLVVAVWDDNPPATAGTQVRNRVSALRKSWEHAVAAPEEVLVTHGSGYLVRLDGHELDLAGFEQCVAQARDALAGGDIAEAARRLRLGLGHWQGPALAGLSGKVFEAAAARLEDRRLSVLEECLGHEIALGRHTELVDEISALVESHPFRERLVHHLMVALSRSGRQADGLSCYHHCASLLREELGIDPGPELQELYEAILRTGTTPGAPQALPASPAARVRPAELPADVAGFAGRTQEIELLDALLPPESEPDRGLPIIVVTGMGGVGKTALAVHWAHRQRRRFPDGQLFVNLQGFGHGPAMRPIDALATTLRILGVGADQVPVDSDESARLLRSLVAGKSMLFALDNAASAEQVRPLLPGTPGCLVIVTSRDRLSGLVASHGARRLTVGPLMEPDAIDLLSSIVGRQRVAAESQAAAELVRVCASLPLALRIAAANLEGEPLLSIDDYLKGLREGDRLAALRIDGDTQAVDQVFDTSYHALPASAQRVFRLLGLVPGSDISIGGVAALAGLDLAQASHVVDRLTSASLVQPHAPGRIVLHDLLRLYANQRSEAEDGPGERRSALENLCNWYLDHARVAASLLHPHMLRLSDMELPPASASFKDHVTAMAWLDAERSSLVSSADHVATSGPMDFAWLLADTLRGYFWLRGHTVDWLATAHAGIGAAIERGNARGQAAATISLAFAHYSQGQYREAISQYRCALDLSRQAGWREGEATALGNLGLAHSATGQLGQAAEYLTAAALLDRRSGRALGLATTLCTLGPVEVRLGRPRLATDHLAEALELYQNAGSFSGEAMGRANLAYAMQIVGRFNDALAHITRALRMYRQIGDPDGEATALCALGRIYNDAGHHEQARHYAAAAMTLAKQTDRRRELADIYNLRGRIELELGDAQHSIELHLRAMAEATTTGSSYHDADARTGLAAALHNRGDHAGARNEGHRALRLAQRADYRILEGDVLTILARVCQSTADAQAARAYAQKALSVQRRSGYRAGVERAAAILRELGVPIEG